MKNAYIFARKSTTAEEWAFQLDVESFLNASGVACRGSFITVHEDVAPKPDFSVVLGGDGTVLAAGRMGITSPIIVINTGHLGFLTSSSQEEYRTTIDRFLAGEYTTTKRRTLKVTVSPFINKTFFAVNEAVIAKNQLSKLVNLEVYVRTPGDIATDNVGTPLELLSEYRADGLIVSTPTGSTAYNLSASGPIIHPFCESFVITPICPQGLTQRPIVVPGNMEILLKPLENNLYMSVDGQDGCALNNDTVTVAYNNHILEIVDPIDSYFQILRKKLGWGIKPV